MAAIGGGNDAVDLDLVSTDHRDLGRGGDVAAITHMLGDAAAEISVIGGNKIKITAG